MSVRLLARSVSDLLTPVRLLTGLPVYDGRADANAAGAWMVLAQGLPRVSARAEAGPIHAYRCTASVTLVNQTDGGVRILGDHVFKALEGVRPVASGWDTTPLHQFNEREPFDETAITNPTSNLRFMIGLLEFEYTATRLT